MPCRFLRNELLTNLNAIAEFTIVPIGTGVSLAEYVAACQRVLEKSGLHYELHANGTNLEGDWEEVMQAIKTCHIKLHEMGVPRISTLIKIGTRTDREQKMAEKVASVRAELDKDSGIERRQDKTAKTRSH